MFEFLKSIIIIFFFFFIESLNSEPEYYPAEFEYQNQEYSGSENMAAYLLPEYLEFEGQAQQEDEIPRYNSYNSELKPRDDTVRNNKKTHRNFEPDTMKTLVLPSESKRRSDQYNSVIESLNRKFNYDLTILALAAGCCAAAVFALVLLSLTYCRFQAVIKSNQNMDYPAYGVTGPNREFFPSITSDQKLAQSAQMYHFQHQKQQIIAMEKPSTIRDPSCMSDADSGEENDEGDYTVYECPGLAPTGDMEVKNPMFNDVPAPPVTTS